MHQARLAEPPSRIGADVRAMLTAIGAGDDVLGGVALIGLRLPGLNPMIDAVLVLPRGLVVVSGVDLPGPAVRLEAPVYGPWLVDGWRLVRPGGSPVDGALAAAGAVAARLQAPGVPNLPVSPVVAVGPYVREVIRPDGDAQRAPAVLHPTARLLVRTATALATAPAPCDVETAWRLLRLLAPGAPIGPHVLAAEGFRPPASPPPGSPPPRPPPPGSPPISRGPGPGGRW